MLKLLGLSIFRMKSPLQEKVIQRMIFSKWQEWVTYVSLFVCYLSPIQKTEPQVFDGTVHIGVG